jgi:hypothetical protein
MAPLTSQLAACEGLTPPDFLSYNGWVHNEIAIRQRVQSECRGGTLGGSWCWCSMECCCYACGANSTACSMLQSGVVGGFCSCRLVCLIYAVRLFGHKLFPHSCMLVAPSCCRLASDQVLCLLMLLRSY